MIKIKRWNLTEMLDIGRRLFAKINKRKFSAHHNHEVHFLAREKEGFHYLGIHYLPTRTEDNIHMTHANDALINLPDYSLNEWGG